MFKLFLRSAFLSITMMPLTANCQNYLPPVFADDDRAAKVQAVMPALDKMYKEFAENNHFPGYAYGIVLDGKLIHSGSGGYSNIEKKIPANVQSMFRIASMTKSFTAMAIVKLRDEGKLRLDDPVSLYIPEMKNQHMLMDSPIITVRDLLTHSAGLPQDDPWADRYLNKTDAELIAILKSGVTFSNCPETTYEYSNLAYAMLGLIVKKAAGTSYQAYITENILKPLDMQQTAWEFAKIPFNQLAQGYKWDNGQWVLQEMLHDGSFGAMGGLITSVEEFSRYVALHQSAWPPREAAETGPLKRSSMREMHQPYRFIELNTEEDFLTEKMSARTSGYGYGLKWSKNSDANQMVGHNGGLPGFGSNWLFMPEHGVGVILLVNSTYANAGKINQQVLNTLVQKAHLKPRQLPPSRILQEKQAALIKLLPQWKSAETSGLFADNFFLDTSLETLKNQTMDLFTKVGKIIRIGEIIPENQLRGYFMIEGEKGKLMVGFTLTPENPPLIQKYQIEEVKNGQETR